MRSLRILTESNRIRLFLALPQPTPAEQAHKYPEIFAEQTRQAADSSENGTDPCAEKSAEQRAGTGENSAELSADAEVRGVVNTIEGLEKAAETPVETAAKSDSNARDRNMYGLSPVSACVWRRGGLYFFWIFF